MGQLMAKFNNPIWNVHLIVGEFGSAEISIVKAGGDHRDKLAWPPPILQIEKQVLREGSGLSG